jgi:formate hydrogenlyase transcriptional activator
VLHGITLRKPNSRQLASVSGQLRDDPAAAIAAADLGGGEGNAGQTLAQAERERILAVLRDTDWVLGGPKGAASRLGMKRSYSPWKMKKRDISRPP